MSPSRLPYGISLFSLKELERKYAPDILSTTNEQIIEVYIWVSVLRLLMSRIMYCLVRDANPGKKRVRYTQLGWGTIFAETASDLLTSVLNSCGFDKTFKTIREVYDSQAPETLTSIRRDSEVNGGLN